MSRLKDLFSSVTLRAAALAGLFALAVSGVSVVAQSFVLPAGTSFANMLVPGGAPPVGTGCTIVAGSTDASGACLTTATSGSIAFSRTYSSIPVCLIVDRTATPTAVYSVAAGAITLTTIVAAHNLTWDCKVSVY